MAERKCKGNKNSVLKINLHDFKNLKGNVLTNKINEKNNPVIATIYRIFIQFRGTNQKENNVENYEIAIRLGRGKFIFFIG